MKITELKKFICEEIIKEKNNKVSKYNKVINKLENIRNINNIFVRGCKNIKQKKSIDIINIKDLGFDNNDEAFEYVLNQIEVNGSNALASMTKNKIKIEYYGVHCFTAEEILAKNIDAYMAFDHDNIIIFKGKDLGFNFFGDGTIAKIDKIIEIVK